MLQESLLYQMPILAPLVSLLGFSLGSFLNVCIYRIPRGISIVHVASFCPSCWRSLKWYELLPLLSYLVLKGKCGTCSYHIPRQYFVIEFFAGVMLVLLFGMNEFGIHPVYLAAFLLIMVPIAVIDFRHFIIPNKLLLILFATGVTFRAVIYPTDSLPNSEFQEATFRSISAAYSDLLSGFGSSFLALSSMLIFRFLGNLLYHKESLGMGDVKLGAMVGLFLGFEYFLVSIWLAAIAGSIWGLTGMKLRRNFAVTKPEFDTPNSAIEKYELGSSRLPFGSFLAFSSSIVLLFQESITDLVSSWMTYLQ